MEKIVRTKSKALGGITPAEKARMAEHAKLWISRAMRTDPIEPDKIIPAIEGLYAVAGLKKPKVVIVSSPLVMAFAYGAASAILQKKNQPTRQAIYHAIRQPIRQAIYQATRQAIDQAIYQATDQPIRQAIYQAIDQATRQATYQAIRQPTYQATYNATDQAIYQARNGASSACYDMAGQNGLEEAKRWYDAYQGGNMWAGYDCYLTSFRDILGLDLKEHAAYKFWEESAIHGGFRVMHEDFCMVCDFPEFIKIDDENRPHCENGPSHKWRDGWSLYHWHGQSIPAEWIENPESLTPEKALTWTDIDQRTAACEILGWHNIINALDHKVIDEDDDPQIGRLIEIDLPDHGPQKFIHARCGTGREIAVMAHANAKTILEAQAASYGLSADEFIIPEVRT